MDQDQPQNENIIMSKGKADDALVDTTVPDITNLNIKSRLSPPETDDSCDEPRANGLHQVNGIYNSPRKNSEIHNSLSGSRAVETSHLNELGKFDIQAMTIHFILHTYSMINISVCIMN